MKVTRLRLLNFKGIKELTADLTESTTAFVGINGVGKSTLLEAASIALSQLIWRIAGNLQKARQISTDDIRIGSDFARIEISVELDKKVISWATVTNRKKGSYSEPLRRSDFEQLNEWIKSWAASNCEPDTFPLAAYYDVHRAVLDAPLRVREKLNHDPAEIYSDSLDHGGADFKRFFIWFRNFEDAENELRIDDPDFRYWGLKAAREAIQTFTGFQGLRVRRKPNMRMVVKKGDHELNVLQLSDGERNMLALVGDLARRLSVLNPNNPNPNKGYGVVLIDELDLHLHPRWQRDVVHKLESTFPNCQFIFTTHSPQIIGELRPESVMLLKDGKLLGHARRSLGLSSGEVLEELMDGSARNKTFQSQVNLIDRQIEEQNYVEARQLLREAQNEFGSLPEILRLEESLEWFDPTEKVNPA